jgi:hypothetical protein
MAVVASFAYSADRADAVPGRGGARDVARAIAIAASFDAFLGFIAPLMTARVS